MIRIIIVLLFPLSIFSCNQQPKSKAVKRMINLNGKFFSEKQIGIMIINLNHAKDSIGASKLLDTLRKFNGNIGFIYFEKGIVENYYSHYNESINDFKTAQSLKYNQKKCQTMILVSQSMRDGTNYLIK